MERLHRHNIYPIVLLLKFRHHKQIREVCDSHLTSSERISQKEAKEMFELANKMEQEYKHVISGNVIFPDILGFSLLFIPVFQFFLYFTTFLSLFCFGNINVDFRK